MLSPTDCIYTFVSTQFLNEMPSIHGICVYACVILQTDTFGRDIPKCMSEHWANNNNNNNSCHMSEAGARVCLRHVHEWGTFQAHVTWILLLFFYRCPARRCYRANFSLCFRSIKKMKMRLSIYYYLCGFVLYSTIIPFKLNAYRPYIYIPM